MINLLAAWPSVGLLVLLGLIWLEYRLLGGRATLSPLRFLLAFSFGMAGAGILAVLFPLIFNGRLPIVTVSYTWGPVMEETVKALPALLLAGLWLRAGRRLSLVDVTLLGLASGLGFQFIETNLRLAPLAAGEVGPNLEQVARELVPWLQGPPQGGMISVSGGHGLETAFIALAAGIGIKLWPRGRLGLLPALVALAWASLDHAYFNWEVASGTQPIGLFQQLDQLTLQGRLQLYVLPIGLVLAAWLEGRRTARLAGSHPELLVPGESAPIRVVAEWLLAWSRLPLGLGQVWRALTYFRHRRAFLLAGSEASLAPGDHSLSESLTQQVGALAAERERLVQAERPGRIHVSGALLGRLLLSLVPTLLVGLVFLLVLLLARQLPAGLRSLVFGRGLALTFAVLGLLYIGWRWYRFRRQPRPGVRAAGEHLLQYDLAGLLLGSSTLTSLLALYGWFQPSRILPAAAAAAFVTDALSSSGLNPTTILATIGPASAATAAADRMEEPERKPNLADEVARTKARFDELQTALKDEVNANLNALKRFYNDYQKQSLLAAGALEDYTRIYRKNILPDLTDILNDFADRQFALKVTEALDTILQAVGATHGVFEGVAAEKAAAQALKLEGQLAVNEPGQARLLDRMAKESAEAHDVRVFRDSPTQVDIPATKESMDVPTFRESPTEVDHAEGVTRKMDIAAKSDTTEVIQRGPALSEEELQAIRNQLAPGPADELERREAALRALMKDRIDEGYRPDSVIFSQNRGETLEQAVARSARENSIDPLSPLHPLGQETKIMTAERQLEQLTSGKNLQVLRLEPTENNVRLLYEQYQEGLANVRRGTETIPNYWDRMTPQLREFLQSHVEKPYTLDYWLTRLQTLKQ